MIVKYYKYFFLFLYLLAGFGLIRTMVVHYDEMSLLQIILGIITYIFVGSGAWIMKFILNLK